MKKILIEMLFQQLRRQGELKFILHNLNVTDNLDNDAENQILDEMNTIEETVQKIRELLATL